MDRKCVEMGLEILKSGCSEEKFVWYNEGIAGGYLLIFMLQFNFLTALRLCAEVRIPPFLTLLSS